MLQLDMQTRRYFLSNVCGLSTAARHLLVIVIIHFMARHLGEQHLLFDEIENSFPKTPTNPYFFACSYRAVQIVLLGVDILRKDTFKAVGEREL